MRAGRLNRRITIQVPTDGQSGTGAVTLTWATFATRWATAEPLAGGEGHKTDQFYAEHGYRFMLRRTTGVLPSMRISWDGRVFDITGIQDIRDPKQGGWMTVLSTLEDVPA